MARGKKKNTFGLYTYIYFFKLRCNVIGQRGICAKNKILNDARHCARVRFATSDINLPGKSSAKRALFPISAFRASGSTRSVFRSDGSSYRIFVYAGRSSV